VNIEQCGFWFIIPQLVGLSIFSNTFHAIVICNEVDLQQIIRRCQEA